MDTTTKERIEALLSKATASISESSPQMRREISAAGETLAAVYKQAMDLENEKVSPEALTIRAWSLLHHARPNAIASVSALCIVIVTGILHATELAEEAMDES